MMTLNEKPMHCLICLWCLVGLLWITGCTHTPPESVPTPVESTKGLYDQAEDLFQSGDMEQALTKFNQYLQQNPQGPQADHALLRVGDIHRMSGDLGAAQAFYQRLVDEYPQSPWADQARIYLIDVAIGRKGPEELDEAYQLLADPVQRTLLQQLASLYDQGGPSVEIARNLYLLYRSENGAQKEPWLSRLRIIIDRLNGDEIESLWMFMADKTVRSYLMFRYAMLEVMAENDDDALDLLNAFQAAYPNHPLTNEVFHFINTLSQRMQFEPLTVGCLLPLSGSYQTYGLRALNGVELALSQMSFGETTPAVKIVVMDTGSQDAKAIQGVRELAAARVAAIIGPIVTASAAAREAQRLGIPMVTFTQKPDIATIGDCIFRHFITPQTQVDTLSKYLFNDLGLHQFAVMYPRETYGQTFMELFWDAVIRRQGILTGVEAYDPKLTDFADSIKKLVGTYYPIPQDLTDPPLIWVKDSPYLDHRLETTGALEEIFPDPLIRLSGLYHQAAAGLRSDGTDAGSSAGDVDTLQPTVDFDALFIPDAPNKVGLILPQLAYYDVRDIYLIGTNLWHSDQLIEMTKEFSQNALMVDGFFKESQSSAVQAFVQGYMALYQKEPGVIEAFAYDTAHLIFSLLNRPDVHSFPDMRVALQQSLTLQGATGPVYFADTGEAIKRLSLLRIKGGRFIEIALQ